jgi:drug/metabolite transporter (DMT)-like permease
VATVAPAAVPAASTRRGVGAASSAVVLWSAGNVLAKAIPMAGPVLAWHRLWLSSALLGLVLWRRGGRLDARTLRLAAPGGVAFGLNISLFFTAVKMTSMAHASLIANLQPLLILLVAAPLFGERVARRDLALGAVALGGMAVVLLGGAGQSTTSWAGNGLAGLALVAWTAYFILSKQARSTLDTLEYQVALGVVGAAVVLPFALVSGSITDLGGWPLLGVLAMVAGPGSGHLLMNWAHQHCPILIASMLTLGMPVLSVLFAVVLLGESLLPVEVAGMAVTLGALGLLVAGQVGSTHSIAPPADAGIASGPLQGGPGQQEALFAHGGEADHGLGLVALSLDVEDHAFAPLAVADVVADLEAQGGGTGGDPPPGRQGGVDGAVPSGERRPSGRAAAR